MSKIVLVEPLVDGQNPLPSDVVLVACDKKSRFAVDAESFKRYSKFAENVLMGESEGEMPLDSERAPAEQVQLLATWIKGHEKEAPSRMAVPMPRRLKIEELFTNQWDLDFIHEHFVGINEDMTKCRKLYNLALLSVYLQVQPLTEMIATFFAFKIRRGVRETGEPTKMVRRWFGKEGDYTLDEVNDMTDWVRKACDGMELPAREEQYDEV